MALRSAVTRGSPFVGRERELRAASSALAPRRVVTILGAPGVGKTRLAEELAQPFGAALAFVDLSLATTSADAGLALARELDAQILERGELIVEDQLGAALAARGELLVVFDNAETVSSLGALLARLVELAPQARFLVTSRELLRLPFEVALELPPLELPPASATPAEIVESPAVKLFVERARRVRLDYDLAERDALDVAAIVHVLDGLPLAIELCASKMDILGPRQIRERLASGQFVMGATTPRGTGDRHASLNNAIAWSFAQLDEAERSALAALAAFRGGFDLDAAQAVLDLVDSEHVLELVARLHARSLLFAHEPSELPGERRYRLFHAIREFIAARAELAEVRSTAAARHVSYFVGLGADLAEASRGPSGAVAFRRLLVHHDDLLHALRHELTAGDVRSALSLLLALEAIYARRGPFARYREIAEQALARAERERIDGSLRAKAELALGATCILAGQHAEAAAALDRAISLAENADAPDVRVVALARRARVYGWLGDVAGAEAAFARVDTEAPIHDRARMLYLREHGTFLADRGDTSGALGEIEEALTLAGKLGDRFEECNIRATLGARCIELGDLDAARHHLGEAIVAAEELGDRRLEGWFRAYLGYAMHESRRYDDARALCEHAVLLGQSLGDRRLAASAAGYLANLAFELGHYDEARAKYDQALGSFHATDRRSATIFGAWRAALDACTGGLQEAERRFAQASAVLSEVGAPADLEALALLRGLLELREAEAAAASGNLAEARSTATRLLAHLEASTRQNPPAPDEVRMAARALSQAVDRSLAKGASWLSPPDALVIEASGVWFRTPGGETVDLAHRGAPRALLARLLAARLEGGDGWVGAQDLVAAAWPGERITKDAASLRLRVALSSLRKLGLGAHLQRRAGKYRINTEIPVRAVETETEITND
ncbi:MAG: AAA family ATPase [Polyangiaceae bacterium]